MSENVENANVKLQGFVVCKKGYNLQSFILERVLAELNEAFLLPKRHSDEELKKKRETILKEAGISKDGIPLPENLDNLCKEIKNLIGDIERFCEEQSVTPNDATFSISMEPGKEAVHWEFSGYSDHSAEALSQRMALQPNMTRETSPPNPVADDAGDFGVNRENGTLLAASPTDLLALSTLTNPTNLENGEGVINYLSAEDVASQMGTIFLSASIQQETNPAIQRLNGKYQPFLSGEQVELQMVVSVLLAAVDMGCYIRYRDDDLNATMTYEELRVLLNDALDEPPSNFIGEYLIATSDEYPDEGKDAMLGIGNLIHYFNELHALKARGTALSPVTKNVLLWAEYLAELEKLVTGK
jgi:hypothetical protein